MQEEQKQGMSFSLWSLFCRKNYNCKTYKRAAESEKYEILKKREIILMQVQDYIDSFSDPNKDSYIENKIIGEILKLLKIKPYDYYWALGLSTDSDY